MKKRISAALALLLLLTACGAPGAESTPTPTPEVTVTHTPKPTFEPTPGPTETPEPSSGVYTDWSKLEPYEPRTAVYTRRYADFTDTLIPADDYGPLIPFAGAQIVGFEEWSYYMGYYDTFNLYGLVTLKGEVVVDPVLSSAYYLTENDQWGNQSARPRVMLLGKVFYDEEGLPEERYALCASDGSWCTDFLYGYSWGDYISQTFAHGIPMTRGGDTLVFLDPDTGEVLRELDLASYASSEDFYLGNYEVDPDTGWTSFNIYLWDEDDMGNFPLLFDPQGEVHPLPEGVQWVEWYGEGLVPAGGHYDDTTEYYVYQYGFADVRTGEWAIPPTYDQVGRFQDGAAWVCKDSAYYLVDTAGEIRTGGYDGTPIRYGDYWYLQTLSGQIMEVLDKDLNPVESPLVGTTSYYYLEDGWVCGKGLTEWNWVLARGTEAYRLSRSLGTFSSLHGDRLLFYQSNPDTDTAVITLTDREGNVVAQWDGYTSAYLSTDRVTGEVYVDAYRYRWDRPSENREDYYDLDGNYLAGGKGYIYLEGGLLCLSEDDCTTLTDLDGNVVFRWPFLTGVD